jgi:hypothetical protein
LRANFGRKFLRASVILPKLGARDFGAGVNAALARCVKPCSIAGSRLCHHEIN